ncbi:MAG TPA: xanthine dehydrogenase family protein molybdopterin-binding subunit [Anaerolineaceae bacterium]|nr:xanthine dehydrogenase family protein molybdopterin-binding subunit [Anaerolineaceae bacterium]HPN53732.1 xanthine dehydrogenase family protein molybdopterin-binding subunit [Anaerolineaceae bacterium]
MEKSDSQKIPQPVGENVQRIDALEKVTGSAVFGDDIQFGPGLLHARIKRSPHPHALIKKIDGSKALALPGVKAVVTGEGFDGYLGLYLQDRHIFATDRVRYVGDPVAGVAATTEEIAEKALDLIDVEYEVLPAVFDPEYGATPEAPLLHPDLKNYAVANFIFPKADTNISNHFRIRKGDTSSAWAQCAAVVEHKYRVPHIQHVPIETHVAVARVDDRGKITLWGSSQSPFAQRNLIAKALHISQSDVEVIAPYVGGGFGCKAGVSMEALAVAIAMKVRGRPVKLLLTREEEFHTAFVRQGVVAYFKMGCDKDGKILAMENRYYWDGGAYTEYGVNITRASGYSGTGPYRVPNVSVDSFCVYTNHPVGGPMRGFGMPEMHAGLEQCVDELAHAIKMDPAEIRLRNCVRGGDIILTGMKMHPTGLSECIQKAREAIHWDEVHPASGPNKRRGKGMAIMWKAPAMSPNAGSSAWVEMNEDGTATVGLGGQEIGQGTFTVMAQIAAGTLGIPFENVRIARPVDTDYSPYEWQTVASRLTWSMGNAVMAAAKDAKRQILEVVAEAWKENIDDLDIVNGNVISYKTEESISLQDITIYGMPRENFNGWIGGPIVGRGKFMPTYVTGLDPETGQGERSVVHYTTGAQAVEVEVDLETGRVEVIKAVAAFDVGKAINPKLVKAQMEGGLVQGLSTAFFETLRLKDGVVINPSFVDYRIATSSDAPADIESIIVETAQDDGPFGARGIGEHSLVPTVPAVANAIYAATGVRVGAPPFSAEKVFLALMEAGLVKGV